MDIADRFEIEDLIVRYAEAIDRKDWDLLDTVFTPESVLDYSTSGGPDAVGDYPKMKEWLQAALAMFPMTQHLVAKTYYTVESADRVVGRTLFHNPMGVPVNAEGSYDPEGGGLHVFVVGGWYNDTCVRTPDGWRIAHKYEEQAFMTGGMPPGLMPPEA